MHLNIIKHGMRADVSVTPRHGHGLRRPPNEFATTLTSINILSGLGKELFWVVSFNVTKHSFKLFV